MQQNPFPDPPPPIPQATGVMNAPVPNGGDSTGGLIPYKNSNALIAYYLGLFSLMPMIGLPMGIMAVVLGIKGLQAAKANPIIKGKAHAWVGIICGAFWTLVYAFFIAMFVFAMLFSNR